jgi:hypothetical protein
MVSQQHVGQQFLKKALDISRTVRQNIPGGDDLRALHPRRYQSRSYVETLPGYEDYYVRTVHGGAGAYTLYKRGITGGSFAGRLDGIADGTTGTQMAVGHEHMAGPLIRYAVGRATTPSQKRPEMPYPGQLTGADMAAYEGPQPPNYTPKQKRQ